MSDHKSEATSVAEITRQGLTPVFHRELDPRQAVPIVVWPGQNRADSLERFLAQPVRKRAKVTVHDHQSLIAYVKRHREPGTTIFAELSETGGKFVAILDYHQDGEGSAARCGDHVCTLAMQHTPEWLRWSRGSGQNMEQAAFAQFLEDNRIDIKSPDAAGIIEIAKSLEASIGVGFKSSVRLDNGDRQIMWAETTTPSLTVPDRIKLRLPVFTNGPEYDIEAFLRYKPTPAGVVFRYELIRPHKVIELALLEARNAIAQETALPVHTGSVTGVGF